MRNVRENSIASRTFSVVMPLLYAVLVVTICANTLYAFDDTFEISNYHKYNVTLMHDNKSVFNSNESAIEWSLQPNATFYTFNYGNEGLYFILTSSFNNSVSNETACSYAVSINNPNIVHVSLLNETLHYCSATGFWN